MIKKHQGVLVFTKTNFRYCTDELLKIVESIGVPENLKNIKVVNLDTIAHGSELHQALKVLSGQNTVPQVYISGQHVGGCDDTKAKVASGQVQEMFEKLRILTS